MSALPITPRSLRIFLVENHEGMAKCFRLYLEGAGHQVFEARTVAAALANFRRLQCDVLISEIGLPDGTGWELLQKLRSSTLHKPPYAIAISGIGLNADAIRSVQAGFRHHILKPVNLDKMDALLAEADRMAVRGAEHPA